MQEGALAFAQIMLGRIWSKFPSPPGPNGGMMLNGQSMLQEGIEAKRAWEERLMNRFGDIMGVFVG
jgi:hypothetical protein